MSYKRIIARIDVKGENLVKGMNLEGLKILGKPWDFSNYYYDNKIDEIIFLTQLPLCMEGITYLILSKSFKKYIYSYYSWWWS